MMYTNTHTHTHTHTHRHKHTHTHTCARVGDEDCGLMAAKEGPWLASGSSSVLTSCRHICTQACTHTQTSSKTEIEH